jgi:predicted phage terminase large subunit-like protein
MALNAKDKQFNREVEALRALIQAKATPFAEDKWKQKERKDLGANNLEFFCRTYFHHYFESPSSALHHYFAERYPAMIQKAIATGEGDKEADAAPRGNAKSTWTTLGLPLQVAAYKQRKFTLVLSETKSQAEDFISFIKLELETNERLKQDFPELCDEGPVRRADTIITRNGIKIRGAGAGQKLRGMRHGAKRPDLVICDDLENDEAVESPEQRKKLEKWFSKALLKIGQPDTVYIVIGTILHYDSLLSDLLKRPGWKGKKFQSVISWSKSKLWDAWAAIFADITVGKEEAENRADAFFADHREEMLAGTEVLWPEREPYYYLMKMRLSDGPAAFDSEKQNEPINPEDCLFKEEWFTFWDDADIDLSNLPLYAAIDPSLGKKSKKADPSAILAGRYHNGILWLEIADIEKRHPDQIIEDVLIYHQRNHIHLAGVETVQFQQFFKDTLEKIAHERNLTLNIVEIQQSQDKTMRIQSLQPWVKNGWIRFRRNMRVLIDQMQKFPMADHDDGPDALEILKRLIEAAQLAPQTVDVPPSFAEAMA